MKLTGHKTRAVFSRYNIVAADDLTRAVGRLAAFHEAEAVRLDDVASITRRGWDDVEGTGETAALVAPRCLTRPRGC